MTGLKRFDITYLWLLLLAVPATIPLFQSGYLDTHDGMFHLYRLQALDQAFQAGVFYPRWFPQFAYGYGQPVLNYYSPLTYYVAQLLHMLGAGYILSLKLTFAAGFLLSAAFMYVYASKVIGRFPALVASAVYTYFPYHLADTYLRGALAEAFAFVFLPLSLWAVHRLMASERTQYFILLSLSFSGLILTHNLTALIFTPVLLGYLAVRWFLTRRGRAAVLALGSLAMGVLLATFYWLPVLLETRYVGLAANIGAPGYQRHLAPPTELISFSPLFGYLPDLGGGVDNPFYPLGAVYVLLILAGVGILGWLFVRRRSVPGDAPERRPGAQRWTLLFFLAVALFSIFMMLSCALPVWRLAQGLLASLQYPWRFMSLTGLSVAMVTGFLLTLGYGHAQGAAPWRTWLGYMLGVGLLVVLIFHGLGELPTQMLSLEEDQVTVQRMWEEDFAARQIGATWTAEYVPIWVKADRSVVGLPPPNLVPFEPTELAPEEIPEIELGEQGLLSSRMTVASPQGFHLRFHTFYFPGWKIYMDGAEAPVYPSEHLALLSVDAPPGEHEVLVRFEDTAPRQVGNLISVATGLGLVAFAFFRWRWKAAAAIVIPGVILVSLAGWHIRPFNFYVEPQDKGVNLEDQVKLLGYTLDRDTYRPGDTVQVTLYWLGLQEMSQDYKVFVHLMDESLTTMWAQHDDDPAGGFTPTTRWLRGEVVTDRHTLTIPVEAVPGTYKLFTGLYEWETVRNLTILTPGAATSNNRILLGELEVVAP